MTTTLITGASSGIGEAFARRLAAEKHDLVLVARSEKKLHELCDELMLRHKITAHYIPTDLTAYGSHEELFRETERHGFKVDWLVNNAGFGGMGDFTELELGRALDMISLNISAVVSLTHLYLRGMRERQNGKVINVSSAAGFQPIPFMAIYSATKAFVTAFSEAIAEENRPYGIQVMALCPGSTQTNFFAASNIERPVTVKGQQTPEQVVEAAMRGIKGNRTKVVSGFTNYIGALLGKHTPNVITTRAIGRALRARYQKQ
jgi:short-subunit dehydrogenase